jgi:zinc/manganese transport system substrate-binding protein
VKIGIANHLQVGDDFSVVTNRQRRGVRRSFAAVLCSAFVLTILLLPAAAQPQPKKLRIVTTIFPIYCFATGVIGSEGEVQNLLPPNVGPHDYQLSPSDLRKIKEADVIILNGLALDDWVTKAIDRNRKQRVIVLGELLKKEDLIVSSTDLDMDGKHKHGHEHQHGPANPHIWLNPRLAMQCVSNIVGAIGPVNPAYAKNAAVYLARLKQLDADLETQLTPVREKAFVTQHDAFPYFVARYKLKQVGILEPTPDVSPSPRFLADLLKVIREKKVQVIFNDPRSSPRLAKQVARDAKIRTAELDTLESGKLDPTGYETGMRRNAAILVRELK